MKKALYFVLILLVLQSATLIFGVEVIELDSNVSIENLLRSQVNSTDLDRALDFGQDESFRQIVSVKNSTTGKVYTRYEQTYQGIPVAGYQVISAVGSDGIVKALRGKNVRGLSNELTIPVLRESENDVLEAVKRRYIEGLDKAVTWKTDKESIRKVILIQESKPVLCYEVTFFCAPVTGKNEPKAPTLFVDVTTKEVVKEMSNIRKEEATGPGGNFKIGDYEYGKEMPKLPIQRVGLQNEYYALLTTKTLSNGETIRATVMNYNNTQLMASTHKFDPTHNTYQPYNGAYNPMNDAYYFLLKTIDMYDNWLQDSITGRELVNVGCHFGVNVENAFYSLGSVMIGDGKDNFYPMVGIDVIAHELGHGYVDKYSDLIYKEQSGGINESFADMSGKSAEYFIRGAVNWNVGYDILKKQDGLRYMQDPPKDGKSIDSVNDFVAGMDVHYSSGIFNKAFYTLATTPGWNPEKAFKVFALANQAYWQYDETFVSAAKDALAACAELGFSTNDFINAFRVVDINLSNIVTPTPTTTPQPTPDYINVGLNKPVVVSGEYSNAYPAEAINDGDENSAWGSLYNAGSQWAYIDLGNAETINHIVLKSYNPYYATKYYVGVSDNAKDWSFAATITNGQGGIEKINVGVTARYIGILLEQGPMNVYGIKELEVMVKKDIVTPTPTATPQPTPTPGECPLWTYNTNYEIGFKVRWNGKKYNCIIPHFASNGWEPGAPGITMWAEIQ